MAPFPDLIQTTFQTELPYLSSWSVVEVMVTRSEDKTSGCATDVVELRECLFRVRYLKHTQSAGRREI